jgi:hypothetical protein
MLLFMLRSAFDHSKSLSNIRLYWRLHVVLGCSGGVALPLLGRLAEADPCNNGPTLPGRQRLRGQAGEIPSGLPLGRDGEAADVAATAGISSHVAVVVEEERQTGGEDWFSSVVSTAASWCLLSAPPTSTPDGSKGGGTKTPAAILSLDAILAHMEYKQRDNASGTPR